MTHISNTLAYPSMHSDVDHNHSPYFGLHSISSPFLSDFCDENLVCCLRKSCVNVILVA